MFALRWQKESAAFAERWYGVTCLQDYFRIIPKIYSDYSDLTATSGCLE